jgi:AmiR/NasT family two-component response regulator
MMGRPAHCLRHGPALGFVLEGRRSVPLSRMPNHALTHNGDRPAMLSGGETQPRRAPSRARVLIVHSDASCRDRVAQLLRRSDMEVIDVVPLGAAAIRAARRHRPDLVLLGAGDGQGMSTREATQLMAHEAPCSSVLVFGDGGSEEELDGTISAGAAGYVRLDARTTRIDVTVRIALALIAFREVAEYERGAL